MEFRFLPELEIVPIPLFTQVPSLHRHQDRTAGFPGVGAVGEAAVPRKVANLGEALVDPLAHVEKAQFAHPRGVDQHGALIEDEQMAAGGRMHAFPGAADRLGVERVLPEQPVDEGRLPDSRRAEQTERLTRNKQPPEVIHPDTRRVAEREDLGRDAVMPDRRDLLLQVFGCDQVGLRQDDQRLNVAFACHHQVPVEPPYVEIEVTGLDDEGDIDVCRDHLEVHGLAGALRRRNVLLGKTA